VSPATSAEAQRLLDAAGASLPKLRALTVICAKDHTLITVYRISGVLVWKGTWARQRVTRSTPGDDSDAACDQGILHEGGRRDVPIRYSKFEPQQRFAVVDLFDQAAGPYGLCPCGSFGVDPEWLTQQLERDDLPASGRVVHVLPAT
jgi:hypothetical protein